MSKSKPRLTVNLEDAMLLQCKPSEWCVDKEGYWKCGSR